MSRNTDIPPAESTTFADAWSMWLAHRICGVQPLRASTLADYRSIYQVHLAPSLGYTTLSTIDGGTIARLTLTLAEAGVAPKRLSNVLVPLLACLRWHHRIGLLPRDPSPWFDAPARAADQRGILSHAQIEALLAELPPRRQMQTALRYLHTGDSLIAAADRLSEAREKALANAPPASHT